MRGARVPDWASRPRSPGRHSRCTPSTPSEVTLTDRDKSPTVEARCELLLEILDEMAGRVGTAPELTQAWAALLDVKVQTAQTQVSQCLRILYSRERVVFTDLVERDNGRRVAQYKLVVREGAVV